MVQWVKDLVLSLQRPGSLLGHRFNPWPRELPHATGVATKKKKKKKKKKRKKENLHMLLRKKEKN